MVPELLLTPIAASELDGALICPVFEGDVLDGFEGPFAPAAAAIRAAMARREFTGKPTELYFSSMGDDRRLVAVGLGGRDSSTQERWRRAAAAGALAARARRFERITLVVRDDVPETVAAVADGVITATFDVGTYRTGERETAVLERVVMAVPSVTDAASDALRRGRVLGEAANAARALGNEPGNALSPRVLAERAQAVAAASGLHCDVLDESALESLGMGLLLGVGRGSAEPPRLIVLRYEPDGAADRPTLGFVGKGVTFDTGGISIKPYEKMELMKYDMAGAAAVIAAMQAIAALRPAVRVVGIVPAAENMPGGRAIRPGDVLRSASGKTVEVNNTDAEGRLILADALWYAREHAGVTHLVDVATLTGACVVALGRFASGFFGSDPAWSGLVSEVANKVGDRVWPMPVDDEYAELLRSDIADIVNVGGRGAGAVTAAMFLKAFTGDLPWVHLDIAGTAWLDDAQPWMPKGPTGVMTRTLAALAAAHERI